jgi:hypothetical protein
MTVRGSGALDHAGGDLDRLLMIEFGRLTHDAEHGDARAAGRQIVVRHPVDRREVDAAVVVERGRRDREGARRRG